MLFYSVEGHDASLKLVDYATRAIKWGHFQESSGLGVYLPSPAIKGLWVSRADQPYNLHSSCLKVSVQGRVSVTSKQACSQVGARTGTARPNVFYIKILL